MGNTSRIRTFNHPENAAPASDSVSASENTSIAGDSTAVETPVAADSQPTLASDLTPERYIKVRWVKSAIGYNAKQGATIVSLGLHKLGQTRIHKATDSILGMCHAVNHLVVVEDVEN